MLKIVFKTKAQQRKKTNANTVYISLYFWVSYDDNWKYIKYNTL